MLGASAGAGDGGGVGTTGAGVGPFGLGPGPGAGPGGALPQPPHTPPWPPMIDFGLLCFSLQVPFCPCWSAGTKTKCPHFLASLQSAQQAAASLVFSNWKAWMLVPPGRKDEVLLHCKSPAAAAPASKAQQTARMLVLFAIVCSFIR